MEAGTHSPSSLLRDGSGSSTARFTNVSRRLFRPGDLAPSSSPAAPSFSPSPPPTSSPAPLPEHLLDPRLRPGGDLYLEVPLETIPPAGAKRPGSPSSGDGEQGAIPASRKRPRLDQSPARAGPPSAVGAPEQSSNRQLFLGELNPEREQPGSPVQSVAGYTSLPLVFDFGDPHATGRVWVPVNLDGLTDPHWREFPPNHSHPVSALPSLFDLMLPVSLSILSSDILLSHTYLFGHNPIFRLDGSHSAVLSVDQPVQQTRRNQVHFLFYFQYRLFSFTDIHHLFFLLHPSFEPCFALIIAYTRPVVSTTCSSFSRKKTPSPQPHLPP